MKHIGIAAVTAEGAAIVYRMICAYSEELLGRYHHPQISLHSFSFYDHINVGENRREAWKGLIEKSAEKLCASGADFMICPSNTPHDVYNLVASEMPFHWIHIAGPVVEEIKVMGIRRPLLLGTQYTIESGMYEKFFGDENVEVLKPDTGELKVLHNCIVSELVRGHVSDESRDFLSRIIAKYAGRGADGVILGCTELPLAINEGSSCLPIVDSAYSLAKAAVKYAICR